MCSMLGQPCIAGRGWAHCAGDLLLRCVAGTVRPARSFQVDHSWKLEGAEERAAAVLRQQLGLQEGGVRKQKKPMPAK